MNGSTQLTESDSSYVLPSCRSLYLLPNLGRHVTIAEVLGYLHDRSPCPNVEQLSSYHQQFTKSSVLSPLKHSAVKMSDASHAAISAAKWCHSHKTSASQLLSDSSLPRNLHTRGMLKTEYSESDSKLFGDVSVSNIDASHKVCSRSSGGRIQNYAQFSCKATDAEETKVGNAEKTESFRAQFNASITERYEKTSMSLFPSANILQRLGGARQNMANQRNVRVTLTPLQSRSVTTRGAANRCLTNTKPTDSRFRGLQASQTSEFLTILRKAYDRRRKSGSRSRSSLVRRQKMTSSSDSSCTGLRQLCVVGQSLISAAETTDDSRTKDLQVDKSAHEYHSKEVIGVQQQSCVHVVPWCFRQDVRVSSVIPVSNQSPTRAKVADLSKEGERLTLKVAEKFQSQFVDRIAAGNWCPGKMSIYRGRGSVAESQVYPEEEYGVLTPPIESLDFLIVCLHNNTTATH